MKQQRFTEQFAAIFDLAVRLHGESEADALLVLLDGATDWDALRARAGTAKLIAVADSSEALAGAKEAGLDTVLLAMPDAPVFEKLAQALLESVADEMLEPNSEIVAVYSGFEADIIDSMSFIASKVPFPWVMSCLSVVDVYMLSRIDATPWSRA